MGEEEEAAIGAVTAEVLALELDVSLAKEFDELQLNAVDPREVFRANDRGMAVVLDVATDGRRNLRGSTLGYLESNFDC